MLRSVTRYRVEVKVSLVKAREMGHCMAIRQARSVPTPGFLWISLGEGEGDEELAGLESDAYALLKADPDPTNELGCERIRIEAVQRYSVDVEEAPANLEDPATGTFWTLKADPYPHGQRFKVTGCGNRIEDRKAVRYVFGHWMNAKGEEAAESLVQNLLAFYADFRLVYETLRPAESSTPVLDHIERKYGVRIGSEWKSRDKRFDETVKIMAVREPVGEEPEVLVRFICGTLPPLPVEPYIHTVSEFKAKYEPALMSLPPSVL